MPHPAAGDDIVQALRFRTDLNCGSCVAAVTPLLDGEGTIERWSVDTDSPEKTLTVEGDGISRHRVEGLVAQAGFRAVEVAAPARQVLDEPAPVTTHSLRTFYPLAL